MKLATDSTLIGPPVTTLFIQFNNKNRRSLRAIFMPDLKVATESNVRAYDLTKK